jgi:hypothetical protein
MRKSGNLEAGRDLSFSEIGADLVRRPLPGLAALAAPEQARMCGPPRRSRALLIPIATHAPFLDCPPYFAVRSSSETRAAPAQRHRRKQRGVYPHPQHACRPAWDAQESVSGRAGPWLGVMQHEGSDP